MTEVKNKKIIESIHQSAQELAMIFDRMQQLPGISDPFMERYHGTCLDIPQQIDDGLIKIAVVGAIKSGKTTFVNTLLREDLLKRGAGVVTSIVTRVKYGKKLKANILFKSWDEINAEIAKALQFIPDMAVGKGDEGHRGDGQQKTQTFDLRRKSDRQFLKAAKMRLCSDISVTEGGIRPEAVLIANAVTGYDAVKSFVQADPATMIFSGNQFSRHGEFTGNGGAAFFVKDVLLEIPGNASDPNGSEPRNLSAIHTLAEIADCQGSDATDPSHMVQIQDYLISSHLLIYLISSRTGLREADLRFLKIIQSMGILQNIFFVLNVDLSEHDTLDELKTVEESVKQGLGYFVESPKVYTFSTLFDLFSHTRGALSSKEAHRLAQWKQDEALLSHCLENEATFETELSHIVAHRHHAILLENPIGRLSILARGAKKRSRMFQSLLSKDLTKASEAATQLETLRARSAQFESLMDNSIDNALKRIRQEASAHVHCFFDPKKGDESGKVRQFIQEHAIYADHYEAMIPVSGFQQALYTMFQDFRAELDHFMATHFTPFVAEFIQEQERTIAEAFQMLYRSCYMDFSDIYGEWGEASHADTTGKESLDMSLAGNSFQTDTHEWLPPETNNESCNQSVTFNSFQINVPVDLDAAKRILGLSFPRLSFAAGYSAKIKVDAVARLGFYSVMEVFGKLMNILVRPARATTLKGASKRIRKETLLSVMDYLRVYRDQVEDEYLLPLLQATARDFREKLMEMFAMCQVESRQIEALILTDRSEKEAQLKELDDLDRHIAAVMARIDTLSLQDHPAG